MCSDRFRQFTGGLAPDSGPDQLSAFDRPMLRGHRPIAGGNRYWRSVHIRCVRYAPHERPRDGPHILVKRSEPWLMRQVSGVGSITMPRRCQPSRPCREVSRRLDSQDGLMTTAEARSALLDTFRWESGHADVWRVFADPGAFAAIVAGLVEPWRDRGVTKVLGIESRGFLLGGGASLKLGAGFVAVRKTDGLLPGPKIAIDTDADYRGRRHHLRMQAVLQPADCVLLVDDWAERGSQALAARHLVESSGATFMGVSVLVDQLTEETRSALGTVTALVNVDELGPAD